MSPSVPRRNFTNPKIRKLVATYPKAAREKLLELRTLIRDVARATEGVGRLEECLKWNEPSFLTSESGSGSTIRIDWKSKDPDRVHVYFKCTTRLVKIFRRKFPSDFTFTGNRQMSFGLHERIPIRKFKACVKIALTYHLNGYGKRTPFKQPSTGRRRA